MWQDQARQGRRREEVQLEQRPELAVGRFLHGADLSAAGIVDEHVNAAKSLERLGDGRLALVRDRDVERQRVHAVRQVVERLGIAHTCSD